LLSVVLQSHCRQHKGPTMVLNSFHIAFLMQTLDTSQQDLFNTNSFKITIAVCHSNVIWLPCGQEEKKISLPCRIPTFGKMLDDHGLR